MSLKRPAVAPVPPGPPRRAEPRPAGKDLRQAGLLVVAVGLLLLSLAEGDALRGAAQDDRLAGFGGEDGIWGLEGDDGLSGGVGGDELYGGPGRDVLYGGAGDDFLEAKDGGRDYVDCGTGRDAASVDPEDLVSRSCEMVYPA